MKGEDEVMVCDVSRDDVRRVLSERVGEAFTAETVDGEGTRFTCLEPGSVSEFQAAVAAALGWQEDRFEKPVS